MEVNKKIMGMPLTIIDDDITDLNADAVIDLANKIYEQVQKEHSTEVDTAKLRAIAIFKIVLELQTIKGKQEVFLDTNTKRINGLIKLVDSLGLPN